MYGSCTSAVADRLAHLVGLRELGRSRLLAHRLLKRRSMALLAVKGLRQCGLVVRVHVRVVSASRERDVREPPIDEGLARAFGVDVREDKVSPALRQLDSQGRVHEIADHGGASKDS
jgi:hypothetical protein